MVFDEIVLTTMESISIGTSVLFHDSMEAKRLKKMLAITQVQTPSTCTLMLDEKDHKCTMIICIIMELDRIWHTGRTVELWGRTLDQRAASDRTKADTPDGQRVL